MADNLDSESAQLVIFRVGECLRRSDNDRLAGVDAERVEVLHVADCDTVVVAVAHYLVLYLLPALETLLDEHLRRERERLLCDFYEFFLVVSKARAESAESVSSTDDDRVAKLSSRLACLLHILASLALDSLNAYLVELLNEELAVLGVDDSLHRCTEHLHVVLVEDAVAVEFNAAVERCLSAEREENAVRTLLLYHFLYEVRLNGKEIYLVGNAFRCLHCCDVRVDEHCLYALFAQSLKRLRTRVVELARFANLQGTRTEQ